MKYDWWSELWIPHGTISIEGSIPRIQSPEETLAHLKKLAPGCGITRLSNITGLDEIGVPVWQAVRPRNKNFSVSQGKGLSDVTAQTGALMEALEMYFAENPRIDLVAKIDDLIGTLPYDIDRLPGRKGPRPIEEIEWVSAYTLDVGTLTYLPRDLLNLDFTRSKLGQPWLLPTSTGLAGGNCPAEAVLHGLYEVVERHSIQENKSRHTAIDIQDLRVPCICNIAQICTQIGIRLEVTNCTGSLQVPCAHVRLSLPDHSTAVFGTGCAGTLKAAVLKALLEAIQSRLTIIAGSREDVRETDYYREWSHLARSEKYNSRLKQEIGLEHETVAVDLHSELNWLIERVRNSDHLPIAAQVCNLENDVSICFVVVPGLRGAAWMG
jgi:ribosomal protein S12 methylthiotransferase accessory factor